MCRLYHWAWTFNAGPLPDDGDRRARPGGRCWLFCKGGLGDVVAVVTRYFGGTKLGRAAWCRPTAMPFARPTVALPRAEKVVATTVWLSFPTHSWNPASGNWWKVDGIIIDEQFATRRSLTTPVPP